MVILACLIVSAGAFVWKDLVPPEWRMMAILSPMFAAGGVGVAFLHASTPDPLADLAALEPGEVEIVGQVISPPAQSSYGYITDVRVEHLYYKGNEVIRGGGVEVFASDLSGVGVGDDIKLNGEISPPEPSEDGFDYGRYLSTKRISAVVNATYVRPTSNNHGWIGRIYRRTDVALSYGLHPQEAAIVRGMVLGDRSRIPENLDKAFQRSGITHVLAISGQHVAVLAAMIYFILRSLALPLLARAPATIGLVWLYIVIAGAPPSAIRAGVVATFVLAAPALQRQISSVHFMSVMLAVVLAYNPLLIYNVGFQLSVAAVFGILLLRKPLQQFLNRTLLRPLKKPPELLSNLLAVSLAAQISTAPIIAATFDSVSVIGILTNLIAVPISGPILTLGLLGSIAGNFAPFIAYPINASNGFLVTILEWVALAFSSLPFAAVSTPGVSAPVIPLFYIGCMPAAVAGQWLPRERWTYWAGVCVVWTALWLALVSLAGGKI